MKELFDGWEERLLDSYFDGCMGTATEMGGGAAVTVGDFCFLAGQPSEALVRTVSVPILIPRTEDWYSVIEETLHGHVRRAERYAICKNGDVFDRAKLTAFAAALPDGVYLTEITAEWVPRLLQEDWSHDFCALFRDGDDYAQRGLGVLACDAQGRALAGASSYAVYHGGIEIEIDTRADMRRRGLATACGAQLILECLARGLYPSWDAHDLRSVALAEKLGYTRSHAYTVYLREAVGG